jgi:hypothetical protein
VNEHDDPNRAGDGTITVTQGAPCLAELLAALTGEAIAESRQHERV